MALNKKSKRLLSVFLVATFIAILTTIYLMRLHFDSGLESPCNINSFFDCGTVNKSIYSELFGVPVAIWGFLTYVFLFALGLSLFKKKKNPLKIIKILFAVTLFGTLFSLYLTGIELFVIRAVCLFCVAQQILIIIDLVILSLLWKENKGHRPLTSG